MTRSDTLCIFPLSPQKLLVDVEEAKSPQSRIFVLLQQQILRTYARDDRILATLFPDDFSFLNNTIMDKWAASFKPRSYQINVNKRATPPGSALRTF